MTVSALAAASFSVAALSADAAINARTGSVDADQQQAREKRRSRRHAESTDSTSDAELDATTVLREEHVEVGGCEDEERVDPGDEPFAVEGKGAESRAGGVENRGDAPEEWLAARSVELTEGPCAEIGEDLTKEADENCEDPRPQEGEDARQRHAGGADKGQQVPTDERGQDAGASEDSGDDDDEVYEVEALLDHRKARGGHIKYLIKWKGYDEETWEDEKNLNCQELVDEYWEMKASQTSRKKRTTSCSHSIDTRTEALLMSKKKRTGRKKDNDDLDVEGSDSPERMTGVTQRKRSEKNATSDDNNGDALANGKEDDLEDDLWQTRSSKGKRKAPAAMTPRTASRAAKVKGSLPLSEEDDKRQAPPVEEWEQKAVKVTAVEQEPETGTLNVEVEWDMGYTTTLLSSDVREYIPRLLVDFYTDRLRFTDTD